MLSKPSIKMYVWFLMASFILIAAIITLFQFTRNRSVTRQEDRLTNYHRSAILACSQLESDLFRFQSVVLSAPEPPARNNAAFSVAELRALLNARVSTIVEDQKRYNAPAFERTTKNLIDAHAALEDFMSTNAGWASRQEFLQSDKWAVFRLRVLQHKRLHSARSERVSAELRTVRTQTLRNVLAFTGVMLTIGLILAVRIMALIRAGLAQQQATSDALRESHDRTQAILDNTVEAIVSVDERGIVEVFNKAAEKTFGYSTFEVMGKNISMLMPEPHRSRYDGYIRNYIATEIKKIIGITREFEGRRKGGTVFPIELSISEVLLDGRRIFTGIVLDISERKNLEDQLRQSQKMEAIGRLAGGVAHDFNNILTVIQGYASVLNEDRGLSEESREDLGEILRAASRAQELTAQLLAFSRKQVLQPKPINLNDVVRDAEKMLRRLIGEHIELVIVLDPSLAIVKADPSQVEQIIMNLAVNARDAMTAGGTLRIETANVDCDESYEKSHAGVTQGPHCMLTIRDSGVGMDEETRVRLFEPFFTTKELGKGTGLGLSTVYGIVQQSGGHIRVHSEPDQGASFIIYFKALSQDEYAAIPARMTNSKTSTRGDETVLVVEDEEMVRKLVLRILSKCGYRVIEASSPEEALQSVHERSDTIDLIVTDVIMPGMSGRELAKRFAESHPEVPVLFMSGYTDDEIAKHGVLEDGVHFIQKPFTPKGFAEKVRGLLDSCKPASNPLPTPELA